MVHFPPPRADLVSASRNVPTGAIGFCAWQEALAMSEVSRETVHRGTDDPEEIRMLKEAQASPVSSVQWKTVKKQYTPTPTFALMLHQCFIMSQRGRLWDCARWDPSPWPVLDCYAPGFLQCSRRTAPEETAWNGSCLGLQNPIIPRVLCCCICRCADVLYNWMTVWFMNEDTGVVSCIDIIHLRFGHFWHRLAWH